MNARDLEYAMRAVDEATRAADAAEAARDANAALATRAAEEADLMNKAAHRTQELGQLRWLNASERAMVNMANLVVTPAELVARPFTVA